MSKQHKHLIYGLIICTIGAIFYCYEFVLRIIPGVLQNELIEAFGHISATTFGGLSAFYYFAYSPMQLPVGILIDRYGPRALLTIACLCCAVGASLFAYSTSIAVASLGRFLVGFGSAFAFVGVLSLALSWLPRRFFSFAAGLITTLGMFGLIYGEIHLTEMAEDFGLETVLSTTVVFGVVLSFLIFFIVRDGANAAEAKKESLATFGKHVWLVIKSPQVWMIGFIGACLYTSLSVFGELWGKTYLEQAHNLSKLTAAKTMSALFLGWAVGAPLAGFFSDRTKKSFLTLMIGAVGSLISISLILYYPTLSYPALVILLFLYGAFSGVEIIIFIMAKEILATELASTAFATVNMIVSLGGVFFQPLVGKLLDLTVSPSNQIRFFGTEEYQIALSILPISLVVMILMAVIFLRKKARNYQV